MGLSERINDAVSYVIARRQVILQSSDIPLKARLRGYILVIGDTSKVLSKASWLQNIGYYQSYLYVLQARVNSTEIPFMKIHRAYQ